MVQEGLNSMWVSCK